jgi:hypothetical protein
VARLVREGKSDAEVIDELYLSALSRPPSHAERDGLLARLESGPIAGNDEASRRTRLEDLAWAILTSREFLFNH